RGHPVGVAQRRPLEGPAPRVPLALDLLAAALRLGGGAAIAGAIRVGVGAGVGGWGAGEGSGRPAPGGGAVTYQEFRNALAVANRDGGIDLETLTVYLNAAQESGWVGWTRENIYVTAFVGGFQHGYQNGAYDSLDRPPRGTEGEIQATIIR